MIRDLRIAVFSDAQPGRNGVATYYHDLALHLQSRVETLEFLAPGAGDPPLSQWLSLPLPGDRTQRIGVPSPVDLRSRLKRSRPDVVVVATPGPYGLLAAQYARMVGARVVFGLHTDYEALSSLYWGAVPGRISRWCLAAVNRRLLHSADRVVAISPRMERLARRAGRSDVRLLGTQLAAAFVDAPTTPQRSALQYVIYVGRLAPEKGIPQVIEAAERLPHLRFRIAGDGPLRERVRAAAAALSNLEYLGRLQRDQVRAAIDASDLLILPSAVEAFGTVALEAMARERIALVSAACGIRGWPDLKQGLYRFEAHEHPAAAIERIGALDAAVRQRAARQGRAAAHAMHATTVAQWLEVFREGAALSAAA